MKKSELTDLKSKNLKDLVKKGEDLKKEIVELMLEKSQAKLKNVHKILSKRKEIAQVLTLINRKKYEINITKAGKPKESKEK